MGAPPQMGQGMGQGQGQMNQNMGGGENMGGDRDNMPNPIKKMPNPANFKIVKCKNYDAGNLSYFIYTEKYNEKTLIKKLKILKNYKRKLQVRKFMHFRSRRY